MEKSILLPFAKNGILEKDIQKNSIIENWLHSIKNHVGLDRIVNVEDLETEAGKECRIYYVFRFKDGIDTIDFDMTNCVLFHSETNDGIIQEIYIKQPEYMPELSLSYSDDPIFAEVKALMEAKAIHKQRPNATLLVSSEGEVLGGDGNGSTFHDENPDGCLRVRDQIVRHYEYCPGCHPDNHSEPKAIKVVQDELGEETAKKKLLGAKAYLYGHWWSCNSCGNHLKKAGVQSISVSKQWTKEFLNIYV